MLSLVKKKSDLEIVSSFTSATKIFLERSQNTDDSNNTTYVSLMTQQKHQALKREKDSLGRDISICLYFYSNLTFWTFLLEMLYGKLGIQRKL